MFWDRFVCDNGGTLVPAEVLYGPQEFRITEEGTLAFSMEDPFTNNTEAVSYNKTD